MLLHNLEPFRGFSSDPRLTSIFAGLDLCWPWPLLTLTFADLDLAGGERVGSGSAAEVRSEHRQRIAAQSGVEIRPGDRLACQSNRRRPVNQISRNLSIYNHRYCWKILPTRMSEIAKFSEDWLKRYRFTKLALILIVCTSSVPVSACLNFFQLVSLFATRFSLFQSVSTRFRFWQASRSSCQSRRSRRWVRLTS